MLSAAQWERIHESQRIELVELVNNREFAMRAACAPQYSRVGDWLHESNSESVLEVGCGPGRYVAILAQLGYRVTGIDPLSYPTWDLIRSIPGVQLQDQVRAEELPFADGSYDHAACMGALLYFSDPRKAFTEIHRVMKPGGRLVIRNVNRDNLYTAVTGKKLDPASNNPYTEEELRALVQDTGFTVTNSFTYGFWPPFCIDYWWYLVNGPLPAWFQSFLARCTPRKRGVTVTVFAKRAP